MKIKRLFFPYAGPEEGNGKIVVKFANFVFFLGATFVLYALHLVIIPAIAFMIGMEFPATVTVLDFVVRAIIHVIPAVILMALSFIFLAIGKYVDTSRSH